MYIYESRCTWSCLTRVYTHTHIHSCTCIHIYTCVYIYMYTCVYIYTYTYVDMYTHIHICKTTHLLLLRQRLCAARPRSFRATQTLLCSAPARWPALFQIARAAAPAPARHTPAALVSACVPRVHASMRIEEGWEKGGGRERGRGGHGERGETGQGRAGEGRRETGKEGKRGVDRWRQDCKKPGAAQLPWP